MYALNAKGDDPAGVINAIVDAGGDVDLKSGFQETPLQIAIQYHKVEVVRALLDRGARVDLADWKGDSPVPTAKKKCKHDGKEDQNCCKVLKMVLEAEEQMKGDSVRMQQAEKLRQSGNRAFVKGKFEEARDLYTQSLEVLDEYRSFSNRAACNLEIGKNILRESGYGAQVYRWGEEAMLDAGKATKLEPTFAKAHYRLAMGHVLMRDFPRAKNDIKNGLKHCPDTEALKELLTVLDNLGVPDHMSNPFSDRQSRARSLAESGVGCRSCPFCLDSVPLSYTETCPFCSMHLNVEFDEDDIVQTMLSH